MFRNGPPETTRRERGRAAADYLLSTREYLLSANKVRAWHLLNDASPVGEHKLFALVDAVAALLDQAEHHVALETARRAFETVVEPRVALAAVRALVADDQAL
jgi:hypothetical protein